MRRELGWLMGIGTCRDSRRSRPRRKPTDGLPIGAQFVAEWGREDLLLQTAALVEHAQPWPSSRRTSALACIWQVDRPARRWQRRYEGTMSGSILGTRVSG